MDNPNQENSREDNKKKVDIDIRRVLKGGEMKGENLVTRQPILIMPVDNDYIMA